MSEMMLATIVMPLLAQQDDWLHHSVASALAQTVPTRVLVVTSAHTPLSNLEVLHKVAHPRLTVLRRSPGEGFADAINLGFRESGTERVGLLLTDDWLSPWAVERCIAETADIVASARTAYAADGEQQVWQSCADQIHFDALLTIQEKASYLGHFLMFQRSKVLSVGGVDPRIGLTGADDYDLIWTLLEQGATVKLVPEALYHYRDHDGLRLTLRKQEDQIHDLRKILAKHGVSPEETERLVAQKSKWYGGPCHVAIKDPEGFLTSSPASQVMEA